MADFTIRNDCRLCHSTDLEKLLDFGQTCLANEYPREPKPDQDRFPLYLVGCRKCGHVQLPVVVDPKRLFPEDYAYQSGTSPVFREHLEELAHTIAGEFPMGSRVLDVACNDGTLVRTLRDAALGFDAYGVDPCAPDEKQYCRVFLTSDFATKAIEDGRHKWARLRLAEQRFACITALNVFAHVDDLDDFTRGVKTLLEHDGMFIFEVGYLPDVVKRGLFTTVYHEHLSYHHLTPLVPFFRRHGMALIDAHRIDSQGGSVRVFVRNCEAHQAPSERLRALLDEETNPAREGLFNGVAMLKLKAKELGRSLANQVKQVRSTGGTIAGYGAPAKLTTLLAATGLFPSSIDYVLDDNPKKCGRYVPGTRIPIIPASELYERNPAAIMLFSTNFAEEIQARHAEYKGRWICC